MNFNLTISGESASELVETLQAFALASGGIVAKQETKAPEAAKSEPIRETPEPEQVAAPATRTRAKATPKEEPIKETPQEVAPAAKESKITIEEIRLVQSEKSSSGKRDAVKALLNEYGVAKLTDMDESEYSTYLPKLLAL